MAELPLAAHHVLVDLLVSRAAAVEIHQATSPVLSIPHPRTGCLTGWLLRRDGSSARRGMRELPLAAHLVLVDL